MSRLLVKPSGSTGNIQHITPARAGWKYVGFDVHVLKPGENVSADTDDREVCLVLVKGRAKVTGGGRDFGSIGERMSPFEGNPWSVYVPYRSSWRVTAMTDVELAVCSAPGGGKHAARLIEPETLKREVRGKGTNTRYVVNILPENEPAHSLLVVEVITPSGHWSSYPPHKHDRDAIPDESLLEETYYHRIDPPQGYALQRIYTDSRDIDEALVVEDGDVALVPRGYHPVGVPHGYRLYYLNVMAGPKRTWHFHNDPNHVWVMNSPAPPT